MNVSGEGEWESEAEDWVRWARTPGHDAYWYFRDSFFEEIVPAPGRRTLEIGCGEGRVARDLAVRGHRVAALDSAHALLRYARQDDLDSGYVRATGSALPFPDGSFDIAIAYNSLQVVDDMAATVLEASRVLESGGCLCICVAHPVTDLGRFGGEGTDTRFTVRRDYFESVRVDETAQLDELTMRFQGWTYSLEHYAVAFELAGLTIEAMREPRPILGADRFEQWRFVPLFLNLRARKA